MWADESVFYQFYPLGFCGAPQFNDGITVNRIERVKEWIPQLKRLGINAVYFSPIFESDEHGYDTRDYYKLEKLFSEENDVDISDIITATKSIEVVYKEDKGQMFYFKYYVENENRLTVKKLLINE